MLRQIGYLSTSESACIHKTRKFIPLRALQSTTHRPHLASCTCKPLAAHFPQFQVHLYTSFRSAPTFHNSRCTYTPHSRSKPTFHEFRCTCTLHFQSPGPEYNKSWRSVTKSSPKKAGDSRDGVTAKRTPALISISPGYLPGLIVLTRYFPCSSSRSTPTVCVFVGREPT